MVQKFKPPPAPVRHSLHLPLHPLQLRLRPPRNSILHILESLPAPVSLETLYLIVFPGLLHVPLCVFDGGGVQSVDEVVGELRKELRRLRVALHVDHRFDFHAGEYLEGVLHWELLFLCPDVHLEEEKAKRIN